MIGSNTLISANGFVRQDQVVYSPSPDPFADTPAAVSQDRHLTNFGAKADVTYTSGAHNIKAGGSFSGTRLRERFTFGITDPADPSFAGADGTFNPALAPYDLTNGGSPLAFDAGTTIKSSRRTPGRDPDG